jgi:hypothetical protein
LNRTYKRCIQRLSSCSQHCTYHIVLHVQHCWSPELADPSSVPMDTASISLRPRAMTPDIPIICTAINHTLKIISHHIQELRKLSQTPLEADPPRPIESAIDPQSDRVARLYRPLAPFMARLRFSHESLTAMEIEAIQHTASNLAEVICQHRSVQQAILSSVSESDHARRLCQKHRLTVIQSDLDTVRRLTHAYSGDGMDNPAPSEWHRDDSARRGEGSESLAMEGLTSRVGMSSRAHIGSQYDGRLIFSFCLRSSSCRWTYIDWRYYHPGHRYDGSRPSRHAVTPADYTLLCVTL